MPTPAVRNLIREGKTHQIYSVLQTGGAQGMQTMDASLAELVRREQDHAPARRVALDDAGGAAAPARRQRGRRRPGRRRIRDGEAVDGHVRLPALDLAGSHAKGEVEADTSRRSRTSSSRAGSIVVDISDKHASKELNITLFERVKAADLTVLTRQLSTMVASGMTLLRSLYVLEEQTENETLRDAVVGVRKDVEAGLLFSAALARHPKVFNPLFVAMVAAGETGGRLDEALIRVADQLEKDDSLRRQVKSAMMYPTLIFSFAGIVLIAMVAFLVPVFAEDLQGLRRQAAGDHAVHGQDVPPRDGQVVPADRRHLRGRLRVPPVEEVVMGPRRSGTASG